MTLSHSTANAVTNDERGAWLEASRERIAAMSADQIEAAFAVAGDNIVPFDGVMFKVAPDGEIEVQEVDETVEEAGGVSASAVEVPAGEPSEEAEYAETADAGGDDVYGELNDAIILGPEPEGLAKFLNTTATFLLGEMWGAKHPRNTQDGKWVAETKSWGDWIHTLTQHVESKHKAGPCVVLGSSVEGARKAESMVEMFALGLDIDSGAKLDDVIAKIRRLNLMAIIYTTHSHGKSGLELKRDEVMRKLHLNTDPTLDDVKAFLRDHSKSRYEEDFIEAVTIAEPRKQTGKGVMTVLNTPTLDKYRIVFPMAEAVKLIDLAPTHAEALDIWADKVTGMAQTVLGIHFDSACTDPSRLYFAPRHPKDGEWKCFVLWGDPLNFEDVPTMKKSEYTRNRTAGGAGREVDQWGTPLCYTPSGESLNDWHRDAKDRFQLATVLEMECPDKIRVAGGEAEGHVHHECVFEHEHSSEGGTATMSINALDAREDYWASFCKHDSCQGRHKLEHLEEMLRVGWFDESVLYEVDDVYLMTPGEEVEDTGPVGGQDGKTTSEEAPSRRALAASRKAHKPAAQKLSSVPEELRTLDITAPLGDDMATACAVLDHRFKAVNIGGDLVFVRVPDFSVDNESRMEIWKEPALRRFHDDRKVQVTKKATDKTGKEVKGVEWVNPVVEFAATARRHARVEFAPPPSRIPETTYNTFHGFQLEPVEGDCEELKAFIRDVICAGDGDVFKWVWHWMAHMLQRPGEKPGTALVVHGGGRAGKGTFGDILRALVHPYAMLTNDPEQILGTHAGPMLANSILCIAEEAFFAADKKQSDKMKSKITAPIENINPKHVAAFEMRSVIRFVYDGNGEQVVNIENNGSEERFCVMKVSTHRRGDLDYFRKLRQQINGPELSALAYELLQYDPASAGMEWGDVRRAPDTLARKRMGFQSRAPEEVAVLTAIEEGRFEVETREGTIEYELNDDKFTRISTVHWRAYLKASIRFKKPDSDNLVKIAERLFGKDHGFDKGKNVIKVARNNLGVQDMDDGNVAYFEVPPAAGLRERMRELGYL